MSMRTEWQAAKEKAKRLNSGKEITFKDAGLGKALDAVEAAAKAKDKVSIDMGPAWAKAVDAWVAAGKAANRIAVTYQQFLEKDKVAIDTINAQARHELDTHLTMHIMSDLNKIATEGQRLEPKLKEKRKK